MVESGVYSITNTVNDKQYVGSSKFIDKRLREHRWRLKNDRRSNDHLQRTWNKYGKESFEFGILEKCEKDRIVEREQHWIDILGVVENGYNIRPYAGCHGMSEATRQKVIEIQHENSKLTKEMGLKIYNEYRDDNVIQKQLGDKYNISYSIIREIVRGHHWTTKDKDRLHRGLSRSDCLEIYNYYKNHDETWREVANKFDIGKGVLADIILADRRSTKHLPPLRESGIEKDTVLEIYDKYKYGNESTNDLANDYNVSLSMVSRIIRGEHWGTKDKEELKPNNLVIDEETGQEIYYKYKETNLTIAELSDKYDIGRGLVTSIIKGRHRTVRDLKPLSGNRRKNSGISKDRCIKVYNDYKNTSKTIKEICSKYDVGRNLVNSIIKGRHWSTKDKEPIECNIGQNGSEHHNAKVSKDEGVDIYNEYENTNKNQTELAEKYGYSVTIIGHIVRGEHWTTSDLVELDINHTHQHPHSKISKKDGENIFKKYHSSNKTQKYFANLYDVSIGTIGKITRKEHWTTQDIII